MTRLHRAARVAVLPLGLTVLISGCSVSTARFNGPVKNSFLPQAPVVDMEEAAASIAKKDTIDAPPALYSKEPPNLTPSTQAMLRLTALETRLRKAEDKFNQGKKAYNEGTFEEARRQFNGAIDLLLEAPNQDEAGRQRLERRLEEMVEAIYRYDISGLGAAESPEKFVFESSPRESILEMTFPAQPKQEGGVRSIIAATRSSLPIDAHESVFSAISYFSGDRGKKILEHNLRRSGRYRAMIQRIFNEEGVPGELMYVAVLESGFSPRAVSPVSAVGMWQFMIPAAKDLQLNISAFADERMDPEKATRASARYFKFLYNMFGDWNLALAAYNCGPGCVDRAIQRTGYADYWKLREIHALPRDTDQYVPVILAFIVMAKNPALYGLDTIKFDDPIEYDTLDVAHQTHLELIAAACDRPVADLRDMNPALLKPVAPAGYQMRVPKGALNRVVAAIEAVPADKRSIYKFHRVERGETVASIARKYRMQQSSLTAANSTMSTDDEPEVGDLLLVPATYSADAPVAPGGRYRVPGVTAPVVARRATAVTVRGKAPAKAAATSSKAKATATTARPAQAAAQQQRRGATTTKPVVATTPRNRRA